MLLQMACYMVFFPCKAVKDVKRTLTGRIITSLLAELGKLGAKIHFDSNNFLKHCLYHVCPCLSSAYFSSSVRVSFTQTVVLSRPLRKAPRMKSWAKHAMTSNDLQESARHNEANNARSAFRFGILWHTLQIFIGP